MKKLLLVILLLTFLFPAQTFSQTTQKVDYDLPYPGLLPGNPLYPFKALRDKITEIAISDPLEKSEFYVLQADKRLASSIALFKKGDSEAGEQTISKGLNYLEKSIGMVEKAKQEREEVSGIVGKIEASSAKHTQEIKILVKGQDGEIEEKLKQSLKRVGELHKTANELSPQ